MWRLLLLMGLAGCGHRDPGRAARTAQLAACADAFEKAGAADAGEQTEVLARGCTPACDGIEGWLAARSTATIRPGVFVTPAGAGAAAAPGASQALRDRCVPFDDAGPPQSDDAVVLAAVSRWIDHTAHAGLADTQLPARLEHVSAAAVFALPVPTTPGVPASRYRAPVHARQFVVVGNEIRVGASPLVRLRGGHLEALAVPGAYPGQAVDVAQVGATLVAHAEVLARLVPSTDAASVAPLIVADATTPLARVLDAVTRLGVDRAELAVIGDGALAAHPVVLERRGRNVALPEIDLDEHGITLRGFGDDRQTDWDHLDSELDNFAAVNAPIRALELHARTGTSISDLIRILDACVVARVEALSFIPGPEPASATR